MGRMCVLIIIIITLNLYDTNVYVSINLFLSVYLVTKAWKDAQEEPQSQNKAYQ